MRSGAWFVCVVALALALESQRAYAGETQVTVEKGKVEAATPEGKVTVDAGHKAIMKEGKPPVKVLDDPMVQDAMVLYKWIQNELANNGPQVTHTSVFVMDCRDESSIRIGEVTQVKNRAPKAVDVSHWQEIIMPKPWDFYDIEGNLLTYEKDKVREKDGTPVYSLDIHLAKPVAAGEDITLISLGDLPSHLGQDKILWKEGVAWKASIGNMSPLSLNYNEFLLPKSAVLIGSNMPIAAAFERDGRSVYVIRKYNGNYVGNLTNEGLCELTFLWPDKDGTTLADVPEEYRKKGIEGAAQPQRERTAPERKEQAGQTK